jgi:sulfur transfer complex TusBCD TusB component (DsrH family)
MRKVLYLLSQPQADIPKSLLSTISSPGEEVSVILIEDGVKLGQVLAQKVFALTEDVASRNIKTKFPTVSYRDMLRMIFESDTVITV